MAVIVVDRRRVVLGVLAGEAPGIRRGRCAALGDNGAKRRVLVVFGNVGVGVNNFGNVLVAVVRVIRDRSAALRP